MSKFNVGEEVIVKSSGKVGVIKSREVIHKDDTNRTEITYVVKLGEGFENWKSFTKKELERKPRVDVSKLNVVSKTYKCNSGHILTMSAFTNIFIDDFSYCQVTETMKMLKAKRLRIGYAICNPSDVFNENTGVKIAIHRAKTSPFCDVTSHFTGEFNNDTINALLDVKAEYIMKNLERFIS